MLPTVIGTYSRALRNSVCFTKLGVRGEIGTPSMSTVASRTVFMAPVIMGKGTAMFAVLLLFALSHHGYIVVKSIAVQDMRTYDQVK